MYTAECSPVPQYLYQYGFFCLWEVRYVRKFFLLFEFNSYIFKIFCENQLAKPALLIPAIFRLKICTRCLLLPAPRMSNVLNYKATLVEEE